MNKLVLLLVLLLSMSTVAFADDFGHEGVDVENPSIEEMLTFALEDEVLAYSTYNEIVEVFDVSKPFTNIMKAELRHQEAIIALMNDYGMDVPEVDASDYITLPISLEESYEAGVQAEIDNIALYNTFLKEDIPEDVKDVFEYLIKGSEKHLSAFEKQLERSTRVLGKGRTQR